MHLTWCMSDRDGTERDVLRCGDYRITRSIYGFKYKINIDKINQRGLTGLSASQDEGCQ